MKLRTALLIPFVLSASLLTTAQASATTAAYPGASTESTEKQRLPEVFVSKEGYNPKLFAIFDSLPGAYSDKGSNTECQKVGKAPKYYQWIYKQNGKHDSRGLHYYITPESYPDKQSLTQHVEYAKSSKLFPAQAKAEFFKQFEQLSLTEKPKLSIIECAKPLEATSPFSAELLQAGAIRWIQPFTDKQGTAWSLMTISPAKAWVALSTGELTLDQAVLLFSTEIANRAAAGQSAWRITKEGTRKDDKLETFKWVAEFRYMEGRAELLTLEVKKDKVRYYWAIVSDAEELSEAADPAT